MPTKKTAKKTVAKKPAEKKEKSCSCKNCDCACKPHSQLSFYVLISLLVATMTVLVVSLGFNKSVRDIFRPATYMYNGMFSNEVNKSDKDESGFIKLSAGGAIDMLGSNGEGFLIVTEENCLGCDVFVKRVESLISPSSAKIYHYNSAVDETSDDKRAKDMLGIEETPDFIYIRNGRVYDRIDDVKNMDDLALFLDKYITTDEEEE